MFTQGPSIYFETGDLSTLEYLYSRRLASASSEMHSAAAASVAMLVNEAIPGVTAIGKKLAVTTRLVSYFC